MSYGPLPNLMLLTQWGFVLDDLSTDVALVDLTPALEQNEATRRHLEGLALDGRLMREGDGSLSSWQPAGPALQAAIDEAESAGAGGEQEEEVSGGGSLYREILQRTRDSYSTSPIEDENELKATGEEAPAPRRRLAIQFRRIQKQLLNRALAATVAGGGGAERVE